MRKRRVILKLVLFGSFLLLLPFWLLGGSGTFDLRSQGVNVEAVIFGAEDRSKTTPVDQSPARDARVGQYKL